MKRWIGLWSIVLLVSGVASGSELGNAPPGYQLIWTDEFDGPKLDTIQWRYRTGPGFQSYQRAENVSIEKGMLRIALKKESFEGCPFTGGGVITKNSYQHGYFETRIKRFGGKGWHESFWATFTGDYAPELAATVAPNLRRIEIDGFEQPGNVDLNTFTCGVIDWHPEQRSLSLKSAKVDSDLSRDFHVFGFEVAPDYINFFCDGQLLDTVDMRDGEWVPFNVWLSCIATFLDADPEGACWFDYLRIYSLPPQRYAERKKEFVAKIEAATGPTRSSGTDLWFEPARFAKKGGWTTLWEDGVLCFLGHRGKDKVMSEPDRYATSRIEIPSSGEYTLWVRSRDFASEPPEKRTFRVAIGDCQSQTEFGAHGKDGWAWQKGGSFHLDNGRVTISLIDTSAHYPRCGKLLLTTDPEFVPRGSGGRTNVKCQ